MGFFFFIKLTAPCRKKTEFMKLYFFSIFNPKHVNPGIAEWADILATETNNLSSVLVPKE